MEPTALEEWWREREAWSWGSLLITALKPSYMPTTTTKSCPSLVLTAVLLKASAASSEPHS